MTNCHEVEQPTNLNALVKEIRDFIEENKTPPEFAQAADAILTCWDVGNHLGALQACQSLGRLYVDPVVKTYEPAYANLRRHRSSGTGVALTAEVIGCRDDVRRKIERAERAGDWNQVEGLLATPPIAHLRVLVREAETALAKSLRLLPPEGSDGARRGDQ